MALTNTTRGRGNHNPTFDDAFAVTLADGADQAEVVHYWMVTATGTLKVDLWRGATVTLQAVAGTVYNISVKRFYATGSTATGVIALKK